MIFLDMDGVLANFVQASIEAHQRPETHEQITKWAYYEDWGMDAAQFWSECSGVRFWAKLKEYPWAGSLVAASELIAPTYFLTAPTATARAECIEGKEIWLVGSADRMIPTTHKHLLAAPGRVLVDDHEGNISKWIDHGGIGIGLKQPWNSFELDGWQVIEKLKELF